MEEIERKSEKHKPSVSHTHQIALRDTHNVLCEERRKSFRRKELRKEWLETQNGSTDRMNGDRMDGMCGLSGMKW